MNRVWNGIIHVDVKTYVSMSKIRENIGTFNMYENAKDVVK